MAVFFDVFVTPVTRRIPSWIHPNDLTMMRERLVIPLIGFAHVPIVAISILILSSICDLFDGPLARYRNQVTEAGAFRDAMADKIFILGALFFACGDRVSWSMRLLILGLDGTLMLMRPLKRWRGATARANRGGGIKIWIQSIAVGCVLTKNVFLVNLAPLVFSLAVFFAVLSLLGHLRDLFGPRLQPHLDATS